MEQDIICAIKHGPRHTMRPIKRSSLRVHIWVFSIVLSLILGLVWRDEPGLDRALATPLRSILDRSDRPEPLPPSASHPSRAEPTSSKAAGADPGHEALLAEGVLTLLRQYHLRPQSLDDSTSETAFELFLLNLDPYKLYLTEADINRLRHHALLLDDQFAQGQFALAHEAGALRRKRAALVADWVDGLLAAPFDFTRLEWLETNGKERPFCRDDTALRERWRQVLKRQVLTRMERAKRTATAQREAAAVSVQSNGGHQTEAQLEAETHAKFAEQYRERFKRMAQEDRSDDLERFVNAFVRVYGPHTTYLSPFRKEDFDIHISGSLEGIGAVLRQEEGFIKVQRIVPGSASWQQGQLKPEDIILAVAQDGEEPVDVVDTRFRDIIRLIRGKKGTVVKLTVRKPDGKVVVIPITRDVVRLEAIYAKAAILEHEDMPGRFAYLTLPKFYGHIRGSRATTPARRASADIRRALMQLRNEHVRGLVLDVRGNSGGLLREAVRVSGLFIKTGPIVQTRGAAGQHWVLRDNDNTIAFDGPVVILVNRFSASASEILAAALQDYERAVVVGSVTHGKGTVQHLYSLDQAMHSKAMRQATVPRLGTLKITRYQFYRLNGDSTQIRGVTPDVRLPDPAAHLDIGEGAKMYAIPWNAIEPVTYARWSHHWKVESLRAKSLARQAHNNAFTKIKALTELLEKRRHNTIVSLDKATWMQQRAREEAAQDALQLADHVRFTVQPVEYASNVNLPPAARAAVAADWATGLQGDPWIEEALRVLNDMAATSTTAP
ncbi:Tail-specific protease [Candidatus Entotheonellaceae bacterium PAL068K]